MKKYGKRLFVFLLIVALFYLVGVSKKAAVGVQLGLRTAVGSVLPALFPAMVLSGMVGQLAECLPLPPALTVWLTSHLCGFPLGVRTMTLSYRRGLLSQKQAVGLSAACANASPAFLIGLVGEVVLGSKALGALLFIGQLLLSALFLWISGALRAPLRKEPVDRPLLPVLTTSIAAAAKGGLVLCAYITLFSVLAVLLKGMPGFEYLYGFLEISGGITALPRNESTPFWAAAQVGFSGISVFLQNAAYLLEDDLPLWPMLISKMICGLFLPVFLVFFVNL